MRSSATTWCWIGNSRSNEGLADPRVHLAYTWHGPGHARDVTHTAPGLAPHGDGGMTMDAHSDSRAGEDPGTTPRRYVPTILRAVTAVACLAFVCNLTDRKSVV